MKPYVSKLLCQGTVKYLALDQQAYQACRALNWKLRHLEELGPPITIRYESGPVWLTIYQSPTHRLSLYSEYCIVLYCIRFTLHYMKYYECKSMYVSRTCCNMMCWPKSQAFTKPGCAFLQFRKSGSNSGTSAFPTGPAPKLVHGGLFRKI